MLLFQDLPFSKQNHRPLPWMAICRRLSMEKRMVRWNLYTLRKTWKPFNPGIFRLTTDKLGVKFQIPPPCQLLFDSRYTFIVLIKINSWMPISPIRCEFSMVKMSKIDLGNIQIIYHLVNNFEVRLKKFMSQQLEFCWAQTSVDV